MTVIHHAEMHLQRRQSRLVMIGPKKVTPVLIRIVCSVTRLDTYLIHVETTSKSVQERKEFAKRTGLCFACLGSGHLSKQCNKRATCSICTKRHPTAFHGDVVKQYPNNSKQPTPCNEEKELYKSQTGAVLMSITESCGKSSMIVPVYLSHTDNQQHEILVYALLDTQSDTTFILDNTRQTLGLSGADVKLSLSTMHSQNSIVDSCKIDGLIVRAYDSDMKITLPSIFARDILPANRAHIPTGDMARRWPQLEKIASQLMPVSDCEFGLLIGYNCARALTPREVIPTTDDGPYAQKTDLGWGIVGIVDPSCIDNALTTHSHRMIAFESHVLFTIRNCTKLVSPVEVARMMELDFSERTHDKQSMSFDDKRFLNILESGIRVNDGHYEMPLTFKGSEPILPNNMSQAIQRFNHLRKRLRNDARYRNDYFKSMDDLITKGFAEKVKPSQSDNEGHVWYIPHHGVYHPQKPEKVRVVFDCSSRYKGESLNDYLLQGPDLTNSLVGVLCRFRQEPIAVVCDIEQMFLQFKVRTEHQDYLRFLWWDNYEDLSKEPCEYRMNVHLFGAASSPGCANFGLKQLANDYEADFGSEVSNFIRRDFYVDDGLKSVSNVTEAVNLIHGSVEMCNKRGLRLHKFLSNSKDVLAHIPEKDRAKELNLNLSHDELPTTKTLGIEWCIELDVFQFRITLNNKPPTRRGMLSTLSAVYDPLGIISPIILVGKQLLQDLCKDQTDWDTPLPEDIQNKWERWKQDLIDLELLKINRCFKPVDFGEVKFIEFHHFSDASSNGYGQCSYVRLFNFKQQVHCALVIGKSRVVPLKPITIPRLELTAAVISVKISAILRDELEYSDKNVTEYFWTDSNVVLGYIANDSRRFHVFVANRVQQIRDNTEPFQWNCVSSAENPADIASRGATPIKLRESKWYTGPDFLWNAEHVVRKELSDTYKPLLNDPEVRKVKVMSTSTCLPPPASILERLEYFSDWNRAKHATAICLNLRNALLAKRPK
ncbi:uncharacterized protein LOC143056790 [Mytilus galloprovincialis]|uniref:uncharacterized protein LOC143056790 n=1 Tax=Mytilus galloprovincialis TaxID=29158 RepID=UPI003F7C349F